MWFWIYLLQLMQEYHQKEPSPAEEYYPCYKAVEDLLPDLARDGSPNEDGEESESAF